jgi:hypothetical protein
VQQFLEDQLKVVRTRLDGLVNQDLAQFNARLRERNVGNVVAGVGGGGAN